MKTKNKKPILIIPKTGKSKWKYINGELWKFFELDLKTNLTGNELDEVVKSLEKEFKRQGKREVLIKEIFKSDGKIFVKGKFKNGEKFCLKGNKLA